MKLHMMIACCAFMVVANVNAAVYVKGGSRYPFPRPDQPQTGTLTTTYVNGKQSPHASSSILSHRRYQREASNFQGVIEDTPTPGAHSNQPAVQTQQRASISLPPILSVADNNHKQIDAGAVFEDQRPIDFDLNVRTEAHFVPGVKSVSN